MKKRLISLVLALAMLMTLLPTTVFAATTYGTVSVNGGTANSYTSMSTMANAIKNVSTGTVEVHLMEDWGDQLITINANVTIYMHGHMINRGKTSAGSDNEVFCLNSGASLKIIGSETTEESSRSHGTLKYYNASASRVDVPETITGAVITGGYTNGWGAAFEMKKNNTLELVNVTVVGNRVNTGTFSSYGHGGAVRMGDDNCALIMDNSRICYNYATKNGGAVRIEDCEGCSISMNNHSSIDHNYAKNNGGGIESDGAFTLNGDGTGRISYNVCGGSNNSNSVGGGGGIDVYKGASVIKNVIVEHNATNSYQGGGILVEGTDGTVISGCTIQYNTATGSNGQGGGVFLKHSTSSLADCEIHYNDAATGDGVYLRNGATSLGGLLNITDNGTQSGETWTGTNLYIASGAYINPSLNNTSEIGVTVADASTSRQLSESAGTYSPYCYTYDTGSAYGFKWYNEDQSASNYRYLYLVSAANADKVPTKVTAVDGTTIAPDTVLPNGTYTAADNNTYPMVKTWFSNPSANDSVNDVDAICFFTDGYFFDDPSTYNEHLATMSHALTMAGFTAHLGNKGADLYDLSAYPETLGTRYDVKHIHVRQLLANIGCPEENFYANEFSYIKPQTDSIGVAMSSKELPDGSYLIPVVVRGSDYESEWASNFTLNGSGEAGGFSDAATKTRRHIEAYLDKYGLRGEAESGLVKFWVVGYSRAGATANITAKRLIEDYGKSTVFCYTFEAAQGGIDAAETENPEAYYCIHNIVNAADAVPMVAPTEMGFKRYGVDHYVPGTAAGQVTSSTQTVTRGEAASIPVTTYTDNEPIYTTDSSYSSLRSAMLTQYRAFNPYMVFDDYYSRAEINWATSQLPVFTEPFNKPVSSNQKVEDYLVELMATLQSWKIESRAWFYENFVLRGGDGGTKTTTYSKSFQGALRDVFRMLYGKTPADTDQIIEDVKSVMNGVGVFGSYINAADLLDLYNNVIQGWHTKSHDYKAEKLDWVWGILQKTGVFDNFTDEEIADLEQDWPILGDTLLTLLSKDYQDGDRQVLGTLLYNYQRILLNHYAETVMAWLRASDSNYEDESAFFSITRPQTLEAPGAVAEESGALTPGANQMNYRCGDQVLHLNVDSTAGEAIYYKVTSAAASRGTQDDWQIYTDGIALSAGSSDTPILYTIETYAISYGKVSDAATYNVTVGNYIRLAGFNLSLEGKILVNVYLDVPDEYQNACVTMTYTDFDGLSNEKSVQVSDAETKDGSRVFSYGVPAKCMNDVITLSVADENGVSLDLYSNGTLLPNFSYSVQTYLQQVIQDQSGIYEQEHPGLTELCKAMSDYGYAAQQHFEYETDVFPNEGDAYFWHNASDIAQINADDIATPTVSQAENSSVKFYGASLILESETTLRLWFTVSGDGTLSSETVTPQRYGETNYWYVDITNIAAADLDETYNVSVTDGTDTATVANFGAYNYVKQVLNNQKATENLITLVKALKHYGDKAASFFT